MILLVCALLMVQYCSSQSSNSLPTIKICKKNSMIRIALMGDSLMRRPAAGLELIDKIRAYLVAINPHYDYFNITYNLTAQDGSKIFDIRNNQLESVLNYQPDAFILFWDTDVSNVDEWSMSNSEIQSTRQYFNGNLSFVLSQLTGQIKGLGHRCTVAGPGVLGDDRPLKPKLFLHKGVMLNDYVELYRNQSLAYGCSYVNMRAIFLEDIPQFFNAYPGHSWARTFIKTRFLVTNDFIGEHPNFRGADRDAQQWANKIYEWFFENCTRSNTSYYDDDYRNNRVICADCGLKNL